jgi:protein CpxP
MFQATLCRVVLIIASFLIPGCLLAAAQQPPAPPPATITPSPQSAADARIRALQAQLYITDAQMPQWNAFAQAMRDNATSTDTLFRQRASSAASMSALDNMKSYAQVARAYADNTEALANSFEVLYGVLSDQQKQTIDTLFRQQSAQNAATQPNASTQPYRR